MAQGRRAFKNGTVLSLRTAASADAIPVWYQWPLRAAVGGPQWQERVIFRRLTKHLVYCTLHRLQGSVYILLRVSRRHEP